MQPKQLYEAQIISIDWKEATSTMTSDEFKADLMLFASQVEKKKASGILVDVSKFHHKMEPESQQGRVKNISTRYIAAGVQRFAFLFPVCSQISSAMNQSSPQKTFQTRAFDDIQQAEKWLTGATAREGLMRRERYDDLACALPGEEPPRRSRMVHNEMRSRAEL
jgi:hypothetical protein